MTDLAPSLLDKNAYVEHLFNAAMKVAKLWSAQDALIFERCMQGLSKGKEGEAQELVWKAYELLRKARDLMLEDMVVLAKQFYSEDER